MGGGTAGGFITAGGGGGAGGIAGGVAGGSPTGTGGGTSTSANFTWTTLAFPEGVAPQAVSARPGELYAVTFTGELLRSTGGALTAVPGFSFFDATDVYVSPSGKVYVTGSRNAARVCTVGDCSMGANYVATSNSTLTDSFAGVCGMGERVFAVGTGTSLEGILFEDTNNAFLRVSTSLGIGGVRNCVVAPNGDVFVAGQDGVARVVGGAATPEPINLSGQTARWRYVALATDGGAITDGLLVGGLGSYRSARRSATGQWTTLAADPRGMELIGVVALSEHEFLAVGTPASPTGPRLLLFDTAWRPVDPQPPLVVSVNSISVVNRNELYLIGRTGSSQTLLYRGTR
jgi:hypothetical protein